MKNCFYLLLILIVAFTSCEGRKSHNKALSDSVSSFNKANSIEVNEYIPESYFERSIDTILLNGFRVKIETSTDMKSNVTLTKTKDNINYSTNYRNYAFNITLEKNGEKVFDENFNKHKINSILGYLSNLSPDASTRNFNNLAVLKSIQLNEELSIGNDSVYIDIAYAIPNKDYIDWHTLKIDQNGTSSFIQLTN